jgi:uncharacterized Tic20 family protein
MNLAKRVKELRSRKGFSQEFLAEESGLSLRTIQRIENNETVPRGDTLKRLAVALGTSPDEIVDWKIQEDQNYLILMNLSTFGFLFFPILGIIIPLVMWISKKDKLKHVNELGKAILNFQISWTLFLFLNYIFIFTGIFGKLFPDWSISISFIFIPLIILYLYNIIIISVNTIRINNKKTFSYKPSFQFLK